MSVKYKVIFEIEYSKCLNLYQNVFFIDTLVFGNMLILTSR